MTHLTVDQKMTLRILQREYDRIVDGHEMRSRDDMDALDHMCDVDAAVQLLCDRDPISRAMVDDLWAACGMDDMAGNDYSRLHDAGFVF